MMRRRDFMTTSALGLAGAPLAAQPRFAECDVAVYGATPAGIAAALAAASHGASVMLLEPTARIGGMMTSGLSHTDFRTFQGINGAYFDYAQRILAHYADRYGAGSQQVEDTFRGTQAEPKVNLRVFEEWIHEFPNIEVLTGQRLESAQRMRGTVDMITGLTTRSAEGGVNVRAQIYVDGSYEGDLLAAAGGEYRVGREGQEEFGESLAPEEADEQLQAYNFRLIATQDPENRVAPEKPTGYRREDYVDVLPLLADGTIKTVFGYPRDCIFKAQIPRLPNAKYDLNDVSRAPVRMSLAGENYDWPEGGRIKRQALFEKHMLWQVGLLWFCQNDPAVPEELRNEANTWGWCRDEFPETNHLPPQIYVREARRMQGMHIYTEQDTRDAEGDARAILHPDAIAMGEYSHNCHGTGHEGPRIGGRHVGEFYKSVAPYQVPYGVLAPKDITNLLVPTAMSSSHVGFCALRLEPIWMSLGQAAGHAAALCVTQKKPVQRAPVKAMQRRLWNERAATIYVSDVPPDDPMFAAVQWWGSLGGLHGLHGPQAERRGKNILGQYHQAYPGHAVELERRLEPEIHERWMALAMANGVAKSAVGQSKLTRGSWIARAYEPR